MKIDKQNDHVCYNDQEHIYWNKDTDVKYISVTTLIGKYEQPYDKEFWSFYKAIERLITADQFKTQKKMLLETKRVNMQHFCDLFELTNEQILEMQQTVLNEWDVTNKESTERGTKIHAEIENSFYKTPKCDLKKYGLQGEFNCQKGNYKLLDEKGVYPEYLIYFETQDKLLNVAGQIDLLIKDGNDIYIYDWKGLPLDTPLATPAGWTNMEDIKVGDEVFDKNGDITKVIHVSEVHHNPCFKITFDNSESIVCDHEHRWEIAFKKQKKYITKVMTTEELSLYINNLTDRNSENIPKIINAKPLNLPDVDLPIDPYILGAWLGDGSKACGAITNVNPNFWKEVERRGYKYGDDISGTDGNKAEIRTIFDIRSKLVDLNLLNNKHIPDIYLRASYNQRLDLLRGLMDTDGYYHAKRKRFVMGTSQDWQCYDFMKLISSLGLKPTIFKVTKTCGDKKFPALDVCFSTGTLNPFLVRNQEVDVNLKLDRHSFRNIKSVEKVDTVPTKCIGVDSPTHTFLAGYTLIPTHNTNKKLDGKSYYDGKSKKYVSMKYPLLKVMDCNLMHYTMQLSTYAYMLQRMNPDFNIKKLCIVHYDHSGNVTDYELEYKKQEVELMLKDYKKTLIKEIQEKRRQKIVY